MNIFPKREVPVDFEQLERDVTEHLTGAPDPAYIPKKVPPAERYSPLQVIGHAITRLTWQEAEALGAGVEKEMAVAGGEKRPLAAAIQAWAQGWEGFDVP